MELVFRNNLLLADEEAGFRRTSFGPPPEAGADNEPDGNPPLAGGVGAGVPDGVASFPLTPAICDANFADGCNTPADDPPMLLLLARAASSLARASASISFCNVAFALSKRLEETSPPAEANPSPLCLLLLCQWMN
jgi:hypothetical protein